jgi:AhpD family alkylhydroperoxidase
MDYQTVAPEGVKAVRGLEQYLSASGLEPALIELVKVHASLMNGCAYCVDMHTKEARANGETEQRLFAMPVWRETPFFSPRERVALAWTEAVTDIGHSGMSDALYDDARSQFTDKALVDLTIAVMSYGGAPTTCAHHCGGFGLHGSRCQATDPTSMAVLESKP